MQQFMQYVSKLPKPLSPLKLHKHLREYYKSKDEFARQVIISHNLRLCAKKAINFCYQKDIPDEVSDVYSECVIALTQSLEKYNPYNKENKSFAGFAYKYMGFAAYRYYIQQKNECNILSETSLQDKNGDESSEDLFRYLFDESESHIPEQIASKQFINDILSVVSPQNKQIVQMALGIYTTKKYSQAELAQIYNCSATNIYKIVSSESEKIKRYIAQNYALSYPNIAKQYQTEQSAHENLKSKLDRNQYIIFSYFGIKNHTPKSSSELAGEFNTTVNTIFKRIKTTLPQLSERDKQQLLAIANTLSIPKRKLLESVLDQKISNSNQTDDYQLE